MYVYKAAQLKLIAQATMMLETFVITLYFVAILRIIKSVIVILSTSLCNLLSTFVDPVISYKMWYLCFHKDFPSN
jgi:hypothetical protein